VGMLAWGIRKIFMRLKIANGRFCRKLRRVGYGKFRIFVMAIIGFAAGVSVLFITSFLFLM
jgi:hypothetical protein